MKRFIILLTGLLLGLGAFAKERPNFLIIMADDCTYNDLPLYGGQNAKTPNINDDRFCLIQGDIQSFAK